MKAFTIHRLKLIKYFNGDKSETTQLLFLVLYLLKSFIVFNEHPKRPFGTPNERVLTGPYRSP